MKNKKCTKCEQVKPLHQFYFIPASQVYSSQCKPCNTKSSSFSAALKKGKQWAVDGYESETAHFNAAIKLYAEVFDCPQLLKHLIK